MKKAKRAERRLKQVEMFAANGRPAPTAELHATQTVVTPKLAAEWLAISRGNRRISVDRVAQFARDMKSGHWWPTGDAVKFSQEGRLGDGHHRLEAVKLAGIPVRLSVVRGVPDEAFNVVDDVRSRTFGDQLRMAGVKYPAQIQSIANLAVRYYVIGLSHKQGGISHLETEAMMRAHPKIADAAGLVCSITYGVLSNAILGFILLCGLESQPELVHEFVSILRDNQWLDGKTAVDKRNAARVLRERLIRAAIQRKRPTEREIYSLMVSAWNHFVGGKDVAYLVTRDEGWMAIEGAGIMAEQEIRGESTTTTG